MVKNSQVHEGGKVERTSATPTKPFSVDSYDLKFIISSLLLKCQGHSSKWYFGKTHFGAIPSICNQRSLAYWSLLNESSSPFFILIHWKAFLSSFEKFTDRELLLPVEVPWTIGPNHFWCRTCELVNNKVAAISQDIHSMLDWMKKMSNMSWIHWVSTSDLNFSRFFFVS